MPYDLHVPLLPHFQGYQGTAPTDSTYLFLGKDANFWPSFNTGHGIWPYLTAYLAGAPDWLGAGPQPEIRNGVPAGLVHHPAMLQLWPGGIPYHRKSFSTLFQNIAQGIGHPVHTNSSFVELLCWPTLGNSSEIGNSFLRLFNGEAPEGSPANLQLFMAHSNEFGEAQAAHRAQLQEWMGNQEKIIFLPKSVFEIIVAGDHGDVFPTVAGLADEIDAYWQAHPMPAEDAWLFDTGPRNNMPRVIVTRGFPYFRGAHQTWWNSHWREAVQHLSDIVIDHEVQ